MIRGNHLVKIGHLQGRNVALAARQGKDYVSQELQAKIF